MTRTYFFQSLRFTKRKSTYLNHLQIKNVTVSVCLFRYNRRKVSVHFFTSFAIRTMISFQTHSKLIKFLSPKAFQISLKTGFVHPPQGPIAENRGSSAQTFRAAIRPATRLKSLYSLATRQKSPSVGEMFLECVTKMSTLPYIYLKSYQPQVSYYLRTHNATKPTQKK